ncbi:MAG TPA: SRPBCC domain-containing protein [Candidatus Binataceae bacterium]
MKGNETMKITTPTDRSIVITRAFDAARALVWEAMSAPELLKRWLLGPPGWSMVVCEEDHRVRGAFRYVWRGPGGAEMSMRGLYREVVATERLVRTESFEVAGKAQGEKLSTVVLADQGRRTFVTLTMLFPSREARDAAISSGAAPNYDRLDEVLASAFAGEFQKSASER